MSRDLCTKLLTAESESEVNAIVATCSEMQNPENWCPIDKRSTNFNVVLNQASDGRKALTELMTNMVDAVLMKNAYEQGIDPLSDDAPKSMYEAVDQLVETKNMYGGKLTRLDDRDPWLKEYAQENLVVAVSGVKRATEGFPCYTFVDNGEGQTPENFAETFCSLSAGTKKDIPFVQGRFNMGSSGVLRYCGKNWYKLIISRRYDRQGPWGWTLVRRRPSASGDIPVAEYFAGANSIDKNGNRIVSTFEADILYPLHTQDGKEYPNTKLESGTIVKLYDYMIGAKFMAFKGMREAIIENLTETILPFRLLDLRQKRDSSRGGDRALGVDARPFYGMEYHLLQHEDSEESDTNESELVEDTSDSTSTREDGGESNANGLVAEHFLSDEERLFIGEAEDSEIGQIRVTAIPVKTLPSWLNRLSRNRVFHAVNGQVHFKQSRGFLSRCDLPALMDRAIIIVDASGLTPRAHQEIWKGDREQVTNTRMGEQYLEIVESVIKESSALNSLQKRIRMMEYQRSMSISNRELLKRMYEGNDALQKLLRGQPVGDVRMKSHGIGDETEEEDSYEGEYSPTFVEFSGNNAIEMSAARGRPISAQCDACNDYLTRLQNPGEVILPEDITEKFGRSIQLHNGRLTLFLRPTSGVAVGDQYELNIELRDPAMAEPVRTLKSVKIVIVEKERKDPKGIKPKTARTETGVELPNVKYLTRDGRTIDGQETEKWPDGFDALSGGTIMDLGDGNTLLKINYDNTFHLAYLRQHKDTDAATKKLITDSYLLGMCLMMFGFHKEWKRKSAAMDDDESLASYADTFERIASAGAASIMTSITHKLPEVIRSR